MKKVVLLLMALVASVAAQATVSSVIRIGGVTRTNGNTSMCVWVVESAWGSDQSPYVDGSSYTFNNYVIGGNGDNASITLNGTLNFQESASSDVITGNTFTVTINSNSQHPLWFYGATVKNRSDETVTGCSVTTSSDKHTLTVTIPINRAFSYIVVDYVYNEPFSSSNTVISDMDDEYLYVGNPIEPEPTVTYNGTVLIKDTDYTLSYWGNNRVGTAQLTVTGTGEYAGDIRKSYTLRDVALSDFNSLGNNTYEIATTTDLDYLALYVKAGNYGNDCDGLTFLQTADIAYSYTTKWDHGGENNFTSVGIYGKPFKGTYDGQNHTISGIRIYKSGDSDYDGSQGLFGYVGGGGTVKRVVLADANIVGHKNTGGIVGYNSGAIEDCRVESNVLVKTIKETTSLGGIAGICASGGSIYHCTFKGQVQHTSSSSSKIGGVVGKLGNGTVSNCLALGARVIGHDNSGAIVGIITDTSILTANYYHDCVVQNAENSTTVSVSVNVGVGIGSGSEDQEGARSVHAITLPDDVTATGESVDIDGVMHYAAATTVTLSYSGEVPVGYALVYLVDGTAIEGDSFDMPAEDATVSVTFTKVPVTTSYVDADGTLHENVLAIPIDNTMTTLEEGTYVVNSDVTHTGTVTTTGDITLILADGCTMSIGTENCPVNGTGIDSPNNLTIYGQSLGLLAGGKLEIHSSDGYGIQMGSGKAYAQHSGQVVIRHSTGPCIYQGNITLDGGILDVVSSNGNGDIYSDGSISILGGILYADGKGLNCHGGITLACTTSSDIIRVGSYNNCGVTVAKGKALVYVSNDESITLIGTLTSEQIADIEGKDLTKGISWTDLKTALAAGQSVTLTNDVIRDIIQSIVVTGTVTLDLNGYSLDGNGPTFYNPILKINNGGNMTITDSRTGGNICRAGSNATIQVFEGSLLTLAAGTINVQSGGIYVSKGSFTMTGGTITGGIVSGVNLNGDNARFTMTGGTITGNDVGVDVHSATAMFIVSGNVDITGNTKNSITKDVSLKYDYQSGTLNPIHIGGTLASTARIGVYTDRHQSNTDPNQILAFTDGLKGYGTRENFVRNNVGDGSLYMVNLESGEMAFSRPHTLTVPENVTVSGLTAESDGTYKVGYGDVVTLSYVGEMPAGYAPVYLVNGNAIEGCFFVMPAEDAEVTIEWVLQYMVNISSDFEHGSVVADKQSAVEGETVTLTVTPDEGYELETITVTITGEGEPSGAPMRLRGGSIALTPGENGTYTFEMPNAPVTVNATFKETTVTGVEDINAAQPRSGQRYNLMGQPVGKDYKGIVIEGGKKIIVR